MLGGSRAIEKRENVTKVRKVWQKQESDTEKVECYRRGQHHENREWNYRVREKKCRI